ncbi:site-specific integrase [Prauserella muralis]|uniref:site-specific integrase n=1 Tax=Prauserella muralis TaxID=588067 RepID=UPI0011BF7648|nr:site-specific integrase [Prauserella muralis]
MEAFIDAKDAPGRFRSWRRGSWAALLEYLPTAGVSLADPLPVMVTAVDVLLAQYANYEASERGLSDRTIDRNIRAVRGFVVSRMREGRLELENLTAGDVTAFVVEQSHRDPQSVPRLVTPLRSLLRYLHATGAIPVGLALAVPAVARWKLAGLPKALPTDQVAALLASCDLDSQVGNGMRRSWRSCRGSGFVLARSHPCAWQISIGATVSWP